MADALTEDDFKWLYQQGRSDDPSARAEVTQLVKKMTPDENQAYYNYQKAQTAPPSKDVKVLGVPLHLVGDRPRVDSNMVGNDQGQGIAPEDALMAGQAVRGVVGAVKGGTGMMGKAAAGVTNVMGQAAPVIKYEAAKAALMGMGIPAPLAAVAASAFSAWSPNGATAPNVPEPAVPSGPKAMPPVPAGIGRPNTLSSKDLTKVLTMENAAKTGGVKPDLAATLSVPRETVAAPTPAPVIGKIAPKVYNELAIMARRANISLAPEEEAAAAQLVQGGTSAAGAVTAIKNLRNPAAELAKRLGTPTEAEMNADMRQRALSGQKSLMPKYGKEPPKSEVAAPVAAPPPEPTPSIKAYHGSPHDFEAFDTSKIGTGEGAQAYGHGLYFAEQPEVAQQYRDALKWRGSNWDDPAVIAGRVLEEHKGDKAAAIAQLVEANQRNLGFKASEAGNVARQQAIDMLKAGDPLKGSVNQGRMYEVGINAHPDQFLDWDKPLSQQHPDVQAAFSNVGALAPKDGMQLAGGGTLRITQDPDFGPKYFLEQGGKQFRLAPSDVQNLIGTGVEGKSAYQALVNQLGSQTAATEALSKAGIPGIKYLDQGSRAAGEGSRNFVVFDAKTLDIIKKYGIIGPALPGLIRLLSRKDTEKDKS